MNYTIQQLIDMNTKFILISDRGRYSNYIGSVCQIIPNPNGIMTYEIHKVPSTGRCFGVDPENNVLAWTETLNPEYFL